MSNDTTRIDISNSSLKKYILTGLMTALVFVLTFLIKIPVPYTSGYIHLGDSMIYISVMILGPVFGAFASGVGSMLADIVGGYVQYALPTLIIKSLMAFIMGLVLSGKTRKSSVVSAITSITVWMVFSGGIVFYLRSQINKAGQDNIIKEVAGADADADALRQTAEALKNLPIYILIGLTVLIVILAAAAWFISMRTSGNGFTVKAILGMSAAGMCMVMGYYLVESFMYSPVTAIFSIPANLIQFFGGIIAAGIFAPAVRRARRAV